MTVPTKAPASAATTGYEAELWKMADALRGSMDAAEYKHVVLGLIFLKYVSDAFEEMHARLGEDEHADPEDVDFYRAENIFWVPSEARWGRLQARAKQPGIGRLVDDSMTAVERDNPSLKGVLPMDYARQSLDQTRLGQIIDLVSNIKIGDEAARSKDVLGRVYEYFLSRFADAEGKRGGEFYTPRCIVRLLVEMIEPFQGRVYDPCCGSSGMFVQSIEFIRAHQKPNGAGQAGAADISIYGQESNHTTWKLAKMNLAIRGIAGQIAHGDTFHKNCYPDLKADYILANPPFNVSDWGAERLKDDQRWRFGTPPKGNANFAWVQHMVHHLSPTGVVGFVLANGSMSWWTPRCWTAWSRCPASSSTRPRFPPACGSWPATEATARTATAEAKSSSSTPASWAAWWTAPTANSPTKTCPASPTPTTHGEAAKPPTPTRTSPASARAPRWKTCASTTTCSPPAATSASSPRRKTTSPSRTRCDAWRPSGANMWPKPAGWTRPSRRT